MRYFDIRDFQWTVLVLFLAIISVIVFYLALQAYPTGARRREKEKKEPEKVLMEFPGGIKEDNNPVPPFLILLYVGLISWAFYYIFFIGYRGKPF